MFYIDPTDFAKIMKNWNFKLTFFYESLSNKYFILNSFNYY